MPEEKDDKLVHDNKLSDSRLAAIEGKIYAGNPYTSFNTLMVIAMSISVLAIGAATHSLTFGQFYPAILILAAFFIVFALQMNYFMIENGNLILKNHFFWWYKKAICLNDIVEISIEFRAKRSSSLRIYTNSTSKLFAAGSLRKDNWKELLTDFRAIGIGIKSSMLTRKYEE
jgi:hypothetical protein